MLESARTSSLVTALALGLLGTCLAQEPGADEGPKGEPPVRVGTAPAAEIGSLPPLVREISKRAAKAFLQGDWRQARDAYLEILREDPENALTLANLGASELQLGDLEAARSHLEKALKNQPNLHRARVTLGLTYHRSGLSYLAISTLARAVADQPKDARAHNYLAIVARERGWVDAAERELQEAVAADPAFGEAHYNLALVYMEKRPPYAELARRHYYKAVDLGATPDTELAARIDAASKE